MTEQNFRTEVEKEIIDCIFSAAPIGVFLVENRMIKRTNETMLKIFGFEKEDNFVGKSTRIIYPSEEEYKKVGHIIYNNLKTDKIAQIDTEFKRKDGSTFWGHMKASWLDPSHPMKIAAITISDISWRKLAEQERLEKAKVQAILEMVGTVCHELNQPLQSISGYSELLLMHISEDNPFHEKLKKVTEQIDRMGKITHKLMKITRYEAKDYLKGKIVDIDRAFS